MLNHAGVYAPAPSGGLDGSESDGTNIISGGGPIGFTSGWSVFATTNTAAAAVAPDGNTTAAFEKEDGTNDRHMFYRTDLTLSAATAYTASVYAKINGRRYLQVMVSPGTQRAYGYFDLQGGVVGDVGKTASGTDITGTPTSQIQVGANGYYKCSLTFTNANLVTGSVVISFALSNVGTYGAPLSSDSPTYAGDNASGAYVWRPKVAT